MRGSFRGWGVCIWDGVLVNGIGCYKTGWGVCTEWGVNKRDGGLVNEMES